MSFTNVEVRPDALPRVDGVELLAVHADYPRVCVAVALFVICVVLVALTLAAAAVPPLRMVVRGPAGLVALPGLALLSVFIAWFAYKSAKVIRYGVREHDIIVQSGIFWRKETIQPITRIQHVEITRGPLDKRFGLANLRLFSAGTGHLTFEIPGLAVDVAERIKGFILRFQQGAS